MTTSARSRTITVDALARVEGDTTLVLSPNSAFFKYFERGPTGRK